MPIVIVVDAVVHHVGQETRTEQLTTRSSDLVEFILESVFRRIPSPKYASALLHNVLERHVLSFGQAVGQAGRGSLWTMDSIDRGQGIVIVVMITTVFVRWTISRHRLVAIDRST
jgi:hypothetical protein